jgi:hypothetical protein
LGDPGSPGVGQQLLDQPFRLLVRALAEVMVPQPALRIDEKECRPGCVVEGAPDGEVIVGCDGVVEP